jgi:hypothetical protein
MIWTTVSSRDSSCLSSICSKDSILYTIDVQPLRTIDVIKLKPVCVPMHTTPGSRSAVLCEPRLWVRPVHRDISQHPKMPDQGRGQRITRVQGGKWIDWSSLLPSIYYSVSAYVLSMCDPCYICRAYRMATSRSNSVRYLIIAYMLQGSHLTSTPSAHL